MVAYNGSAVAGFTDRLLINAVALGVCLLLVSCTTSAGAKQESGWTDAHAQSFAREVAARNGLDADEVGRLMREARYQARIVQLMDRPAEAKPWVDYRAIFITPARIVGGVDFWAAHEETLARARSQYGVPEEIIVAIIGVETKYGANTGSFRVLDALATLAFGYPRRAEYFSRELENFVLLTRDNGLDPLALQGSYAGAIGIPQFMPSSYRAYAVDFDGDGKADLAGNPVDAIGSVANYLARHDWADGGPVALRAEVGGAAPATDRRPQRQVAELKAAGVTPLGRADDSAKAAVLKFDAADGTEYWLGFQNFFVIKRYNNSNFYAMAVSQLASEIKALRDAAQKARAERSAAAER
ncbi:MAG TPA: lytic murein transglycosylase B [Pelomicrobium sp.]|nr:lytic murein transglycosylase B [Pelomicrobium sp.]